jgi:small subunit ribosomal protein S17e
MEESQHSGRGGRGSPMFGVAPTWLRRRSHQPAVLLERNLNRHLLVDNALNSLLLNGALSDSHFSFIFSQGVRTKTVKKSARTIVEKYYTRLTLDFHTNKRIIDDVAILPSKRMRNKIAGYTTHLMRRIAKGPVRGISLKLQEEERERRLDFVPEVSALEQETILIDPDTRDLLESLGYGSLNGVAVNQSHRD